MKHADGGKMSSHVQDAIITILSTQVASYVGIAEWGFSVLIETESAKVLFDTGARKDTVLINSAALKIDLSNVRDVVLSHSHNDHINGLTTLRQTLKEKNEAALNTAWVAKQFFEPWKYVAPGIKGSSPADEIRKEYHRLGGTFHEVADLKYLYPGIAITGPIPRIYEEKNWPQGFEKVKNERGELVEWTIPDDQAVIVDTERGLIIITGCGHSGIINTIEYVLSKLGNRPIIAVIGGLHLHEAKEETVIWTGEKIKEYGVQSIIATHCTGIDVVYKWREILGMDRDHLTIGAVGTKYDASKGIVFSPGEIER